MAKKKRGVVFSMVTEPEAIDIREGYIEIRPCIKVIGNFHKGISSLICNLLLDRISDCCSDLVDFLRDPAVDPGSSGKEVQKDV